MQFYMIGDIALDATHMLWLSFAEICIDSSTYSQADAIRDKVTGKKRGFTLNDLSQVVQRAQKNSASGASKNKDLCQVFQPLSQSTKQII